MKKTKKFLEISGCPILYSPPKLRKQTLLTSNKYVFFYNSLEIETITNTKNYFVLHSLMSQTKKLRMKS